MKIDKTSFVTIDYLIRMGEREFYPPSGQPEEISFCMGWGAMPPGLEETMIGKEVNHQQVLLLSPEEAYGEIDRELNMEVPRSDFTPDIELRPGLVFETESEEGSPVYFLVQEVRPETVVIDFNHPLAGKELEITFMVRQVREATKEDLEQYHSCFEGEEKGSHQH
ncbi:MAG: FKBP-type peptidyl-prolyl cis-trans isomerase [Desulfobaccales bacterium]|nr:FKBP-type peptidyl-prolyl cis-trans isomerase [Desulfobaccales bacterium]